MLMQRQKPYRSLGFSTTWLAVAHGAKLTQHRGLAPDAELVAVAVLLHDLGLARAVALPIVALRFWERTSAAPLL